MKRLRPIDDNNQSKLQIGLKSKVSIKKSNLNDKTKSSLILPQKNEKELDNDNDDNEEEDDDDDDDNNNDDMTGLSKPIYSSKQITSSSSTVSDLKTTRPISGGAVTLGDASDSKTATATVTDSGAAALAAVTALATTVASLKTLITTLTNLVLKIQKKVKA